MTDTLIKVDLNRPPTDNERVHNRWHRTFPWPAGSSPATTSS